MYDQKIQHKETNYTNIILSFILVAFIIWVVIYNAMAAHTDMIFTPQDSNLLNTWGRHASSSLNTELSNLQVDNEINSIRNKLSYRELVQDMTVMKCEDPVVVCNFKELLYSSDVVLLVHSKLESSNYVQRQLELLFEIYPGLLIVDFDTSEQGIQLFGYVTDLFNVRNDLPFLFINGQLVPSDTLYSMLKDTSKHFDLLCKLKQFGKDNVKIKRKIVPSNI